MRITKLENEQILLKPMKKGDILKLEPIVYEPSIWQYKTNVIRNRQELLLYYQIALKERYPFVIINKSNNRWIGTTCYGNVSQKDKRLEIGWTWLDKGARGTGLNMACKYLLLEYAFEGLGFERVELKTSTQNLPSRKAILKIGAKEEGILRNHTQLWNGSRRDTVYYGILQKEWMEIKYSIFAKFSNAKGF